jgi:hypothetical protein
MSAVNLDTVVTIQVNKRKKVKKEAKVIEAFSHRYIKVDMEDNHTFCLTWDKTESLYTGAFLESKISCQYDVARDFSAVKKKQGYDLPPIKVMRKRSGRPESLR